MRRVLHLFPALLIVAAVTAQQPRIEWRDWSDDVFVDAAKQKKLVLLDLGAVWCHWCHVMDETTYRDAEVVRLLQEGFISVRVDQARRPDLANRYEDYGWPATILFDGQGRELAKLRGYQRPERMRSLLQAFLDDPTPGPSVRAEKAVEIPKSSSLATEMRLRLVRAHFDQFDEKEAGWGSVHKFLSMHPLEYSLDLAARGDERARVMAQRTLTAQLGLIDPVWGGVYQYSHGGVWTNPHFEKIMSMQADDIRIYARAWRMFGDPRYLRAAESIADYLARFLTAPDGAFYASQDADVVPGRHAGEYFALDDAGRRARGMPAVDRHIFARENGLAIRALAALFGATGERRHLEVARRAANWVVENRGLPGGGFRHDDVDVAGPYLGDTLAMGQALLELYVVTSEREWLDRAVASARFILARFRREGPGLATAAQGALALEPRPQREENIEAARFLALLGHHTGIDAFAAGADDIVRYLISPQVAHRPTAGILLAEHESANAPLEVTIVGKRDDPAARDLLAAALSLPDGHKRVVRWHPSEGEAPVASISFPAMENAAAFICSGETCSRPVGTAEALVETVRRMTAPPQR